MNRKAFLFTVMTLLLLSSLFSLTGYYLVRTKSIQEIKTGVVGDKMRYVISDISESYFDILGINFSTIERAGGITTVKFNQTYTVPNAENYNTELLNYETFLENIYSGLTNTNITITDFTPQFRIMPFQTSFVVGNDLHVYTTNSTSINNILIQIALNESGAFTTGTPVEDIGANPSIHVIIKLQDGTAALDSIKTLKINETNEPFYVQLLDKRIDVYFGLINSQAGTLRVVPTVLRASIKKLEIGYSTTEKTYMTVGSITLNPNIRSVIKQGGITLAE